MEESESNISKVVRLDLINKSDYEYLIDLPRPIEIYNGKKTDKLGLRTKVQITKTEFSVKFRLFDISSDNLDKSPICEYIKIENEEGFEGFTPQILKKAFRVHVEIKGRLEQICQEEGKINKDLIEQVYNQFWSHKEDIP